MWMIAPMLTALAFAPPAGPTSEPWRFVVPAEGDPFEHPPLRAIALSRERPENLKEMVRYRGRRQRYAQLRYGSPGSVRIAVVLDEVGPGEADLYVDADRNRRIETRDKVDGRDRTWRVPARVGVVEGEITRHIDRALIFRRGSTGLTFSLAASGYLEGRVCVGDREHPARRTDGDGNGSLTDAQDRVWIDLDGDGRFDPTSEQFLYASILSLNGDRFAVRSDEFGGRLALERLEGSGVVRLALHAPGLSGRVAEVAATLIGRDGSAVGLTGLDASAVVPIGDYRLGTVTLSLTDPGGGPNWHFVFSDNGGRPALVWHKVPKGGALTIDPIGVPVMGVGVEEGDTTCRAGDILRVQPRLYTGDGLLITTCYRGGEPSSSGFGGPSAEVSLVSGDRPLSETSSSGFA